MAREPATSTAMSSPGSGAIEVTAAGPDGGSRSRRADAIRRTLLVVLGLNLLVAAAKLGYGVSSGSVAMTADGVQSLLDGLANVIGLAGIAIAAKPPDREHHYGHERYETLAAVAIAGLMAISVVEIAQSAIARWQSGDRPEVTAFSFVILLGTMAVNAGVSVWERRAARRWQSDLLVADARHTASDVVVSATVIVGLLGERFGLAGADAAVSLVVAGVIAWTAWGILREASLVLTDASFVEPGQLLAAIVAVPGVVTAHNLRARSSGGRFWVEVHITVHPNLRVTEAHELATAVEARIRRQVGPATQALVHVEPAEPPHTRPDPLFGGIEPDDAADPTP
ncbi:MAG: cation diffusion facilitator family transporter [Chloroflexota bacterium]|nr:cation diffusion facilitator family transporter [Chloroflexota bacterium]